MSENTQGLTRADYQTALDVQDACNLSGVLFTFAEIMHRVCETAHQEGHGTDWKNSHPIVQLFVDKLSWLSGTHHDACYGVAYDAVETYLKDHPA